MKTFLTRHEANKYLSNQVEKGNISRHGDVTVRVLSKKLFPRRKKRFMVGSYMEWLNT